MPSKTKKQAHFMAAIAHGWKPPGGGGPSVAVAKDFNQADKGRKFADGGSVMAGCEMHPTKLVKNHKC